MIKAFRSPDGATWTPVGQHTLPGLPETVSAGMFVTAHRDGTVLGTATFDHVAFESADDNGLPLCGRAATSALPSWPVRPANSAACSPSPPAGDDVWGTTDQMRFVRRSLTGDGTHRREGELADPR